MHTHQFDRLLAAFSLWGFDTRGWSKRTRALYSYHVKVLEHWLATERDQTVRRASQQEILAFLSTRPPTPETRNSICCALQAFYCFLVSTERRRDNPIDGIARFRKTNAVPKALDTETASYVLAAAHAAGAFRHAIIATLLYTGVRNAEMRSLEWTALEGDAWLRVHGKGNKTRVIPMHRTVRTALKEWRETVVPSRFIFPSPRIPERSISASTVNKLLNAHGEQTGVPGLHPHMCRHTFATRLLEQGADIRTVQELLGHANVGTTQVYTRVRPASLVAAMERLSF